MSDKKKEDETNESEDNNFSKLISNYLKSNKKPDVPNNKPVVTDTNDQKKDTKMRVSGLSTLGRAKRISSIRTRGRKAQSKNKNA